MSTVLTPPQSLSPALLKQTRIFLAGSIEMGKATLWQNAFAESLSRHFQGSNVKDKNEPFIFLNPRRSDWDNGWSQDIENPQFYQQVNWELDALEKATHIVMYLEPGTMSPISLLELGLFAQTGKLLVVCPEGFWRKGNVDIVCNRYNVKQFERLEDIERYLLQLVTKDSGHQKKTTCTEILAAMKQPVSIDLTTEPAKYSGVLTPENIASLSEEKQTDSSKFRNYTA